MSSPAIIVERLGKQYQIGRSDTRHETFREMLVGALTAPFRRWRQLGGAGDNGEETIWALKDVSFEVQPGEVVGIIGRNGAGKSTLLKILSRITEPTEGRAVMRGRVASLLEVGTGFHPELTGRENIYLNGAILGMRKVEIKRKFDEIVAFSEIEKFLDTPVKRYSSGMYVRLAFAVAAHLEPEILVVDEVLAVGDAEFQKKCLGKMREVSKGEGRTVLFVSHNMNAIEQMCMRAVRLDKGYVLDIGSDVRRVVHGYLHKDSAGASGWANEGSQFENAWFKPLRFAITDADGEQLCGPVPNNSQLWVEIQAEVRTPDPALTVGYAIYTESAELLYWSYPTDAAPAQAPVMKQGTYLLRSRIPSRFLNEGSYRIELIGGLHFRQWLFEPGVSAPTATFEIRGGLSDSPYWMARRPGLLAPVLPWVVTAAEGRP